MSLTLLIMAAGLGSRYGGLKQLDTFGPQQQTLLEYSIADAYRAGFDRILFIIRPEMEASFHEAIAGRLDKGLEVEYVHQKLTSALPEGFSVPEGREKPWGTGHAVLSAKEKIEGPFVVINADDYYGPHAFEQAAEYFASGNKDPLIVTYALTKTLSPNGGVSRGLCEVEAGTLRSVTEHTDIHYEAGVLVGNAGQELPGNSPVSMNFWGFSPGFLEVLETEFNTFLERQGEDPKAEFYLPSAVNSYIQQGLGAVTALPSEDTWCGVTYQEDRDWVNASLERLNPI